MHKSVGRGLGVELYRGLALKVAINVFQKFGSFS
jgi:hypothetical protein